MMQNNQKLFIESSWNNVSGYKVVEMNVSDATDSLYAVVTPVKNNIEKNSSIK